MKAKHKLKTFIHLKLKLMKNLLLSILIITGLAACKNNADDSNAQNRNIQLLSDSAAYSNNVFSDTNITVRTGAIPMKVSDKKNAVKRTTVTTAIQAPIKPVITETSGVSTSDKTPVIVKHEDSSTDNNNTVGTDKKDTSSVANTSAQPQVQKKKGLNKAAQGAIIGGVAGAVGGAIISKKKGVGAVVGGIIGAAGGYIIGNKKDKKDKDFVIK